MDLTEQRLPTAIASLPPGTSKLKCRIACKNMSTKEVTFGKWFDIDQANSLISNVNSLNRNFNAKESHWVEYS